MLVTIPFISLGKRVKALLPLTKKEKKMGYFYIGYNFTNKNEGYCKIGETGRANLFSRVKELEHIENFSLLEYIYLPNATKAQRLFVESYVRRKIEQNDHIFFQHCKLDHFYFNLINGDMLTTFKIKALAYALEACELAKIKYTLNATIKHIEG